MRFFRDKLPHWPVADPPSFVTLCRKGCLPPSAFSAVSAGPDFWFDRYKKIDAVLNAKSTVPRDLTMPALAQKLFDCLDWLRERGWHIWAGCIMPSHLHLVLRNTEKRNHLLAEDLGAFMTYTAVGANRLRGVDGPFWQRECIDHACREDEDWIGFVRNTARNPVEAGLVKTWRAWRWTVVDPELEAFVNEDAHCDAQ
jgi:REP element-mobilizing transposase RayT